LDTQEAAAGRHFFFPGSTAVDEPMKTAPKDGTIIVVYDAEVGEVFASWKAHPAAQFSGWIAEDGRVLMHPKCWKLPAPQ
jgi:hypothetical protein